MDDTAKQVLSGYTNIALFGLDNRSNGDFSTGRSDTLMIASINNDTKQVRLVSVYRDTFLNMSDNTYTKANAAYSEGGPQQAMQMLNMNLDLDIKNYVAVDFNAVVDAVDLLGGVQITLTNEEVKVMNGQTGHEDYIAEIEQVTGKKSTHLKQGGTYNLDGVQATAYARIRYTAGDDYKRAERQRTVLTQLITKAKQADLPTLNKLINAMFSKISTSYSNTEILSLVAAMKDYDLVDTSGFPYNKNTKDMSGSGSSVIPCDLMTNVKMLHQQLFSDERYTPSNTVQAISKKITALSGYTANDAVRTSDPTEGSSQTTDATDSTDTTEESPTGTNGTTGGTTKSFSGTTTINGNTKSSTGTTNGTTKSTTGTTNGTTKSTTGTTNGTANSSTYKN